MTGLEHQIILHQSQNNPPFVQNNRYEVQTMDLQCKKSKIFLLPRQKFCVFKICSLGMQMRKHSRNIQSQGFLVVPKRFLVCSPYATYVGDTKSASWKQEMLLKFSINFFWVLDAFLLLQQCFLVSFALMQYTIQKINMLHNLSCCKMRFRLLCH